MKKSWVNCSFDDLCRMDRDNLSVGGFWILTDSHTVTIAEQKPGESVKHIVSMPRRVMNRFVAEYIKERELERRKKGNQ